MTFLQQLKKTIKRHQLWDKDDHVLIAVSGGVDSMVLLHAIKQLPEDLQPEQIGIVHVNHHTRPETDTEERAIKKLAERYDLPIYIKQWTDGAHVSINFEQVARDLRYDYFDRVMSEYNYTVLLTAHHRDDQTETVLMRLIRGGLIEDKVGIPIKREFKGKKVARPLLKITKDELYRYAKENDIIYFEDSTNQEANYTRNRIRQRVIPLLEEENNQASKHLAEFSDELDDLLGIVDPIIKDKASQIAKYEMEDVTIQIHSLLSMPEAMSKLTLTEILKRIFIQEKAFKKKYVLTILDWLDDSTPNSTLDLAEPWTCVRQYDELLITKAKKEAVDLDENYTVHINEWVTLSETEQFGVFHIDHVLLNQHDLVMSVPAEALHEPFTIRHRQNGDRMSYKGGSGTKKIKDIFIDQKISKIERDQAWVVEDNAEEILWLVGYQESQLSNDLITDKINYIFVYRKL